MEERDIVSVTPIEETEWENDGPCMSAKTTGEMSCEDTADKVLELEYENEPGKTFYTCLCESCSAGYVRKWDQAQIYGDQVLDEDNPYRIK